MSASPYSLGLASRVAVSELVCSQCGGPLAAGVGFALDAGMLQRLDRFALSAHGGPLFEPRREGV
jgi:hypothetical protein